MRAARGEVSGCIHVKIKNLTCMTLALISPTHPTGFSPVSSSKSAMFVELAEEGEREPAAYSLYEGSYDGQNARAEMIPAWRIRNQFSLLRAVVPFSPSLLFLDGVVASRMPSPGQLMSNTSIASSKPQYSLRRVAVRIAFVHPLAW
jgi:hypothetical protein